MKINKKIVIKGLKIGADICGIVGGLIGIAESYHRYKIINNIDAMVLDTCNEVKDMMPEDLKREMFNQIAQMLLDEETARIQKKED